MWQRLRLAASRHELLIGLVQKEFQARYSGSLLGVGWTQLYPLLLLAVYTFIFSIVLRNPQPRYPLFLFCGIIIWQFFSTAANLSTGAVRNNAHLVAKLSFPRELLVIAVVATALVDFLLSQVILIVGTLAYGVPPAWSWLALVPLAALLAVFATGLGLMLACAGAFFRDTRFFVEISVYLLMFLSPVFYSPDIVPQSVNWYLSVNPLAIMMIGYRGALLQGMWPTLQVWGGLALAALLAGWLGLAVFYRGQRRFVDAV